MAAHIVTACNEILSYSENDTRYQYLEHGLGYSIWGNQLDLSEYAILLPLSQSAAKGSKDAQRAIREFIMWYVLPRVRPVYEGLQYPDNYEQWMERLYPETQSIMEDRFINLPD